MQNVLVSSLHNSSSSILINHIYSLLAIISPYTVCHLRCENSLEPGFNVPSIVHAEQSRSVTLDPILVTLIEQGCSTFIVDHQLAMQFLDSFITAHDKALYCNTRKAVIFTDVDHELLVDIQRHPAIREILYVQATIVENYSQTQILTVNAASAAAREGDYIYDSEFSTDLYSHLNGQILKLTTFEEMPIIKLVADHNGNVLLDNESYIIDGLDGIIVTGFCRRYNCTWELTLIDSAVQFGQLYPNGSGDGMIGALLERRVDVGIAGVSVWYHLFPYFSFTATLQRVGINCLTPRPKMLPSWITLINAFSDTVWILFAVCIVCYSYILHLILKRREPLRAIQQVFAAFLLQATNLQRRSLSETIFSVALLLATINLAYIYLGKEASMRNFPYMSSSIDTIDQLAESGLPWNAPHDAWKYSLLTSDNPSILTILKTFKALPATDLLEKANEGKENFAFVRLNFGHYMFGDWITEGNVLLYQPMSEDIYWEHETVWTTKTWPYLELFNQHIMQSWEAGLPQYEELIMVRKYLNYKVQIEIEHSRDRPQREPKTLRVADVYGVLVLLFVGLSLSGVIFIAELIYFRIHRNPGNH